MHSNTCSSNGIFRVTLANENKHVCSYNWILFSLKMTSKIFVKGQLLAIFQTLRLTLTVFAQNDGFQFPKKLLLKASISKDNN